MDNVGTLSVDEVYEANDDQGEQEEIVDCAQRLRFPKVEVIGEPDCENLSVVANANAYAEDVGIACKPTSHEYPPR